jgi:hypothetical protein
LVLSTTARFSGHTKNIPLRERHFGTQAVIVSMLNWYASLTHLKLRPEIALLLVHLARGLKLRILLLQKGGLALKPRPKVLSRASGDSGWRMEARIELRTKITPSDDH